MLHAQLHRKLRYEQENLEDLLTSNVFGALRYVEASEGVLPFLACAEGPGASDLRNVLAAVTRVDYVFWPWLQQPDCRGCEPDVLLRLFRGEALHALVLIEAKYRSGKSSEALETSEATVPKLGGAVTPHGLSQGNAPTPDALLRPNDQLAREWDNLVRLASDEGVEPFLVYVTASYTLPSSDIEDSQRELAELRDGASGNILWLSWRAVTSALGAMTSPLVVDLVRLMRDHYDLSFFEGVSIEQRRAPWVFSAPGLVPALAGYGWPRARLAWTYRGTEPASSWRFTYTNHWEWQR